MKNTNKIIFLIFFLGTMMACQAGHDHDSEEDNHEIEAHAAEEMHEAEEVSLTALQIERIGLELGTFEQKNLKSTIKVNGQLELPPQNKADVSAIVGGKITRILVRPGERVKKGTPIAHLQNPTFIDWQEQFLEIEGKLVYLNKELERQKDLVAKTISPQKELDRIISEKTIAQAKLNGLRAKLKLIGLNTPSNDFRSVITIRSPLNGYIREIKANTGIFVKPEQALFEIVDNHHLHIDLKVFEKNLPFIKEGQKIEFSLQSQPNEVMEAYIFAIGKALDKNQRTIDVHAEIKDEKSNLLPGMYVEARIITDNQLVPTLPNEAITIDKGLKYIFVKEEVHEEETHFIKVPVLTGTTDFGYTEIKPLEILAADAEIVTKSAYFLMAESKKGEEGSGHSHAH